MGNLRIVCNNVPRDIIEAHELSAKEREAFDYIDWAAIERGEGSASFFRYKGRLYDLGDIPATRGIYGSPEFAKLGWDGVASDSFFSGIVVKYVDNFERVVVGWYSC